MPNSVTPVKVINEEPLDVNITSAPNTDIHHPPLPPRTTFQEDLTLAGQRRINLIWEYTQASIAVLVVVSTMVAGLLGGYTGKDIPTILSVAFGTIVGFYFGRTNHANIGGLGPKAESSYSGR